MCYQDDTAGFQALCAESGQELSASLVNSKVLASNIVKKHEACSVVDYHK